MHEVNFWSNFGNEPTLKLDNGSQGCQKEPTAAAMRRLLGVYAYEMIEGIKTYKPEVKASKSDKRLRSYGHSKFCTISYSFSLATELCSHLLYIAQTPTQTPMGYECI